jgi:uncharacterized protein (DUF2235 family)
MTNYVCRRLILFLDGTWNDDEEDLPATNVVYLRELLFWGLQRRLERKLQADQDDFAKLGDSLRSKAASGLIFDGFEYVVYYGRGVGTGPWLDRVTGGAFGLGLDDDIRRAYKFLSYWFRPGDEIFVFGFSRGSFTARSLCGYLHAVGLLRCEHCTPEYEKRAWDFYRTAPQDRLSGDWEFFRKTDKETGTTLVHDSASMRIRALSVFDTVGALGIPGNIFWRANRSKYAFHDTDVNTSVDIRLHAMAIDEPRPEFVASVWTKPKFQRFNDKLSPTEQVWFSGAHGDVGGGYVKWTDKDTYGLSHIPLTWMIQRLNCHLANTEPLADVTPPKQPAIEPRRKATIPFFEVSFFEGGTYDDVKQVIRDQVSADQHSPWALARLVRPNNSRVINQLPIEASKKLQAKGRIQHADPIGEMIHVSAFERLKSAAYRPGNLLAAIPFIAASYWRTSHNLDTAWKPPLIGAIFSWQRIYVVDWEGVPLDPANADHARRVFEIIPTPEQIGVTAMPPEMENFLIPQKTATAVTAPAASVSALPVKPPSAMPP